MRLKNYARGEWVEGTGAGTALVHAVTGEQFGEASSGGLDFGAMVEYARNVGGPRLRRLTFHERARMLKALAQYLMRRKDEFYPLSAATGATKGDSWVDIEGGIGVLFVYASKGRRRAGPSSAATSASRGRGWASTSTPSTSPSGGCSRSSPPPSSPGSRRS